MSPIERGAKRHEGKAKIVYETNDPHKLLIYYKDDATAFNGAKKSTLRDKGIVNNTISHWIFRYLEKHGIATHQLEKISDRETVVQRVEIIPIEVVLRNKATGSITKRLGIEKGTVFNPPLIEYFYKSDELGDPLIGETHILHFKWATLEELNYLRAEALKVNALLKEVFDSIGLELIDYKLEFGKTNGGKILLADEFTPDGCRLWDKKTGEPMDKDRFRLDLGGVEEAYGEVRNRLEKYFEGRL